MTRPGDPSLHLDQDDTLELLKDVLSHLRGIQGAYKGSMGSINNVYLPQLRVDKVDELAALVSEHLSICEHKRSGDELDITPEGGKERMMELDETSKTIIKILQHNTLVASYLGRLAHLMKERALVHDSSKFSDDEFAGFVRINQIAREHEYGSPEYMASIKETDAVALHYSRNPHHPKHYLNGIDDMTLLDIIEMVADWKAASETYGQTSLEDALDVHIKRFDLRDEHLYLIRLIIEVLE